MTNQFDFDNILSDLYGGSLFGDRAKPTAEGGFVQPKHEHLLSYDAKVQSRIACNRFLLRALAKDQS